MLQNWYRLVNLVAQPLLLLAMDQTLLGCKAIRYGDKYTVSPMRTFYSLIYLIPSHRTPVTSFRRRSDIANERLPTRVDSSSPISPTFPPPSMRRGSEDGINMEMLIKKTLSEDVDDGGYVQRIADTIAKERPPVGRPRALKRFETT